MDTAACFDLSVLPKGKKTDLPKFKDEFVIPLDLKTKHIGRVYLAPYRYNDLGLALDVFGKTMVTLKNKPDGSIMVDSLMVIRTDSLHNRAVNLVRM